MIYILGFFIGRWEKFFGAGPLIKGKKKIYLKIMNS
jgi:hypothetical protein